MIARPLVDRAGILFCLSGTSILQFVVLVLMTALLSGCQLGVSVYVPEASGREAISALAMTCASPVALDQDCSIWSGATRAIEIDSVRLKVAGSSDGRTILLAGEDWTDVGKPDHDLTVNGAYESVKTCLQNGGIHILSVDPVASAGLLYGYIIVTDSSESYPRLKTFSVK